LPNDFQVKHEKNITVHDYRYLHYTVGYDCRWWGSHVKSDAELEKIIKDEQPIGGHAMVMIGYDLSKKRILCLNSFGKYWCNSGTCWMTFDYAKNEVMDGWVFDLDFA